MAGAFSFIAAAVNTVAPTANAPPIAKFCPFKAALSFLWDYAYNKAVRVRDRKKDC